MPTADEIRLALSLYGSRADVTHPTVEELNDPVKAAFAKAIDGLLTAGLLDEARTNVYEGNEALTMWVEALALVPFPVQRWTIPRFRLPDWDED